MSMLLSDATFCLPPKSVRMHARNTRVLLIKNSVSDAHLVRSAMIDLLGRDLFSPSFKISWATRLSDAIAKLAHEAFDVIILALSLPDNEELEDAFIQDSFTRIHKVVPAIPIIVMRFQRSTSEFEDDDCGTEIEAS